MSKPFANPFFEADMSKLFPMTDMSKMAGGFRLPQWDMEAFMGMQRKNMEAWTALSQATLESWQSLYRRQSELYKQTVEEATQSMSAVVSCPSPEEKVIKQAEVSKMALDKCLANVRDIAETLAKCNNQALETVSTRMNEGMNELRGIITNRAA